MENVCNNEITRFLVYGKADIIERTFVYEETYSL